MKNIGKNIFDIVFGIFGFIILSPILLIITILIKIYTPGKVFFKQERIGKDGKPFKIFKFRTMVENAESMGLKITVGQDSRITKLGDFLRKYKLDELPQIFNILRGEMSFVGPRPEVKRYVDLYNEEQRKVLSIKPGITDMASIKYRKESELLALSDNPEETYINEIMPEKLKINLEYVENASLIYDIKLILETIKKVFIEK